MLVPFTTNFTARLYLSLGITTNHMSKIQQPASGKYFRQLISISSSR